VVQLHLRRADGRRWLGVAHFYAPAPANLGLEATQVGIVDASMGNDPRLHDLLYPAGLLTPVSVAFGIMLSRIERRRPVWSITAAVCWVFISDHLLQLLCLYRGVLSVPGLAGLINRADAKVRLRGRPYPSAPGESPQST
jgi:hypothetical protein